jgi:hypothetical protein
MILEPEQRHAGGHVLVAKPGISLPEDYITSTNSARTVIVRTPHTLHFRIIVAANSESVTPERRSVTHTTHVGRQRAG